MNNLIEARRAELRRAHARRGMSLVEIMVVIAIITTLMGIVGYIVMDAWQDSRREMTVLQMGEINKQIELHSLKHGLPSTSDGLGSVFRTKPVPKDAWGNEFVYVAPGPNGLEYDLISYGSDGREGGADRAEDIKWSEVRAR